MKRQAFRLGTVLKYYVVQKKRTEFELQEASRLLRETDAACTALAAQISTVVALLAGPPAGRLTTAGWIACYRQAEKLDQELSLARTRRARQAQAVAQLEERRQRWAQAEETLLALRRTVEENNKAEAAKEQQIILDETVLRHWLLDQTQETDDKKNDF